jgi:hypothetical protein|uniref:Uncharacterized protein n=1 Tax=viral metagenome TaxID=1070528 RepID=A0A6C0JCS0_9ZZZZ
MSSHLVEPGVHYFYFNTLKKCHTFKEEYYNYIYNIIVILFVVCSLSGFLYYKYKGKLSYKQQEEAEAKRQMYIMEKIKNYKHVTKHKNDLITSIPQLNSEYNVIARRFYN